MIIAIILMLMFARYTWLLAEHLEEDSELLRHNIIDEQSLESKRALLERCLYHTTMIEEYEGD